MKKNFLGRELGNNVKLERDLWEALSYKLNFLFSVGSIIFSSTTFYFLSRLISGENQALAKYGGNYFSFVIIGVAFSGLLNIFQEGLAHNSHQYRDDSHGIFTLSLTLFDSSEFISDWRGYSHFWDEAGPGELGGGL